MDEGTSSEYTSIADSFVQIMPSPERLPHPLRIALKHIREAYAYASEWTQMLYNFYIRDAKSVWSVISGIMCFFFFLISGLGLLIFFLLKTIYDVLHSWLNFQPMTKSDNDSSNEHNHKQQKGAWRGSVVIFTAFAVSVFTGIRISRFLSSDLN